jgi:DNA-binding GntR family transcriptional regulator
MTIAQLNLRPVEVDVVLKDKIYTALKQAIAGMNVYATPAPPKLDERQLSEALGVSRTPIREAMCRLEQEGFVRTVPRKGAYVVRKTKQQLLEMITVWAALESMAARLITLHASDEEIASLRKIFATIENSQVEAKIDEYSEMNISFHQALLKMSRCQLLTEMTENMFVHMRWIRMRTIGEDHRASRSIVDHMHIIEALERRDTDLAERLSRDHTLGLADHVEKNVQYLTAEI